MYNIYRRLREKEHFLSLETLLNMGDWWNGLHRGLKILTSQRLWVRIPHRLPMHSYL